MHGNDHGWGSDLARRIGVRGMVERITTREGVTLHIQCGGRKGQKAHIVDVKISPNLDPNGVAKQMLNRGWTLGRRKIACPDCGKRKTTTPAQKVERAEMPLPVIPPEVTPPPVPVVSPQRRGGLARATQYPLGRMPPHLAEAQRKITPEQRREWGRKAGASRNARTTPEQRREWGRKGGLTKEANRLKREEERLRQQGRIPAAPCPTLKETKPMATQEQGAAATASEKARIAKREALDTLALAFKLAPDGKSGVYSDGYSDARIAKETGVAEAKVKELREEFYGPLGEPDELRELRDAMVNARRLLDETFSNGLAEVARIERKFTTLAARMGWPVT